MAKRRYAPMAPVIQRTAWEIQSLAAADVESALHDKGDAASPSQPLVDTAGQRFYKEQGKWFFSNGKGKEWHPVQNILWHARLNLWLDAIKRALKASLTQALLERGDKGKINAI